VKESIPHATVTFYGDCVKICEHLGSNFDDKHDKAPSHFFLFTGEFSTKTKITPHSSIFPLLQIKETKEVR
jgi:hypothetical protein